MSSFFTRDSRIRGTKTGDPRENGETWFRVRPEHPLVFRPCPFPLNYFGLLLKEGGDGKVRLSGGLYDPSVRDVTVRCHWGCFVGGGGLFSVNHFY